MFKYYPLKKTLAFRSYCNFQVQTTNMSHQFFDFKTLEEGTSKMVQTIKQLYSDTDPNRLVLPKVLPGFLRNSLPQNPPEKGMPIDQVIQQTKRKVYPGIMLWSSPRFFGYFPSTIAVTNILAQMFSISFNSPGFTYVMSPSHTEMQNLAVDWIAMGFGLPKKFLLENQGGGTFNNSMTQSILVSVHAAKNRKMEEIKIHENRQRIVKFVGYYGQFSFYANEKALKLKQIFHYKPIPVKFDEKESNFILDTQEFERIVEKDVQNGLIPFWYGATYGTTFSCANDLNPQTIRICKKYGMWINVDAAYLGSSWLCSQLRPDMSLIEQVDSFGTNFSKALFMGNGGNVFFIADKKQLIKSMGSDIKYSFLQNEYTNKHNIIDYKNWSLGSLRKNNGLTLYYLFRHFGLQKLREYIRSIVYRAEHLAILITDSKLFKMYTRPKYGLVCFQLCDKSGQPNNQLTHKLSQKIANISEGYSSAGHFKGHDIIRIVIGNHSSTLGVIERYFEKIVQIAEELLTQQTE